MYEAHFGLREPPFSLTPDTAFFFAHPSAQSALNTLLVALRSGEGFVKIVGEVGCGKTLLCRRLLAALAADSETAYIPNPALDAKTMLLAVCEELQIPLKAGASNHHVLKKLERRLLERAHQGRKVVLVIDEAQAIPDETVEVLRLMSNLETEKRKLLQIVLFGQPELDAKLSQVHLRQLMQRIAFSERITPLSGDGVGAYVSYRVRIAGGAEDVFEVPAVAALARRSAGIPRVINIIAHKAMMLCFGEGGRQVLARHVTAAADDTPALPTDVRRRSSWWSRAFTSRGRNDVPA